MHPIFRFGRIFKFEASFTYSWRKKFVPPSTAKRNAKFARLYLDPIGYFTFFKCKSLQRLQEALEEFFSLFTEIYLMSTIEKLLSIQIYTKFHVKYLAAN
jgi:hypothetical protein